MISPKNPYVWQYLPQKYLKTPLNPKILLEVINKNLAKFSRKFLNHFKLFTHNIFYELSATS